MRFAQSSQERPNRSSSPVVSPGTYVMSSTPTAREPSIGKGKMGDAHETTTCPDNLLYFGACNDSPPLAFRGSLTRQNGHPLNKKQHQQMGRTRRKHMCGRTLATCHFISLRTVASWTNR